MALSKNRTWYNDEKYTPPTHGVYVVAVHPDGVHHYAFWSGSGWSIPSSSEKAAKMHARYPTKTPTLWFSALDGRMFNYVPSKPVAKIACKPRALHTVAQPAERPHPLARFVGRVPAANRVITPKPLNHGR